MTENAIENGRELLVVQKVKWTYALCALSALVRRSTSHEYEIMLPAPGLPSPPLAKPSMTCWTVAMKVCDTVRLRRA